MKFSIEMSVKGEAADPENIVEIARAAERAGFAMLGYTDHPAPSKKWLSSGGHPTFDPFTALGFLAAVTEEIRLMTYLAVLPYRNPMLLAKSIATIDRLSRGRFTLVVGTGYLRSEFSALGRSFEDRNDLFDEAIKVVRAVYQDDEFEFEGRDFTARGVIQDPLPIQLPHPPIWVGGSSRASRRRAARYGDGWAPLRTDVNFARVVRTAELSTSEDIAAAIKDLRELYLVEGRDPEGVSVQLDGFGSTSDPSSSAVDRAGDLQEIGVTHVVVRLPVGSTSEALESIERYGADVISASL